MAVQVVSLSAGDRTLLHQAEQIALRNCLAERGFRYWPMPEPGQSVFSRFPYVIDSVAWASRYGFGPHLPDTASPGADPNFRYLRGLPRTRRDALAVAENGGGPNSPGVLVRLPAGQILGHSRDGCVAVAQGALYGSFSQWFRLSNIVEALGQVRYADVVNDAAFLHAAGRWSRCMRNAGFRYATPMTAWAAYAEPSSRGPASDEIAVAVAEARCANTTGLAAVSRKLDAHYRHILATRYRTVILAYNRIVVTAITRAPALMTTPMPGNPAPQA